MAKKAFLKDHNDIEILPITRGELVLDSSGNPAFSSNEFLATTSQPGLMSKEDKIKINSLSTYTLEISNLLSSGKKIATLDVGGTSYNILAPATYAWSEITDRPTKLSQFTDDVVVGKYLPLTGGTIESTSTSAPLIIKTDSNGWLMFRNTAGYLGEFGFSSNKIARCTDTNGTARILIHAGNVGEYALKNYGNQGAVDYNNVFYNGIQYVSGASNNTPVKYGVLMSTSIGDASWQLLGGRINEGLYFRGGGKDNTTWGDWKTIAFTDSTVAAAYKLVKSTGTEIVTISDDGTTNFAGAIAVAQNITINPTYGIAWRVAEENIVNVVTGSTGNFILGNGGAAKGYKTYLDGGTLYFRTYKDGASQTAMTITEDGNVLIKRQTNNLDAIIGTKGLVHIEGGSTKTALGSAPANGLTIGYDTIGGLAQWIHETNFSGNIQAMNLAGTATAYALNLNPLGGAVNIASADAPTNVFGALKVGSGTLGYINMIGSGVNYLWAATTIHIGLSTVGGRSGDNATLTIKNDSIHSGFRNNAVSLGTSTYRWSEVYSVNGNFSGTITGNIDGTYVNKLTGYAKATAISALAATDTLNTALGKLEYKADVAYNLVKGAYDGDGTIENLAEILKVLEGISDTETIQAIVGKYLPLTGGTLTGQLKISQGNLLISSGHTVTGWLYPKDDGESYLGQEGRRWENTYTVLINGGIPLQSNNYNSYAPKLDGTGATGTWNINISGTAADASTLAGHANGDVTARYFNSLLLTKTNTLNNISDGVYCWVNADNPTNSVGDNSALLQLSGRKWDRFQLAFPGNNDGKIFFRNSTYESTNAWIWHDWKTIAFTSDIPTKVSQLTNDSGYLTSASLNNYVTLNTAQIITGEKTFATNILTISNHNSGDATLKFSRGSNTAWTIVDTGGNLKFNELTSNTTRLVLYENSQGGSAAFAGSISATSFIKSGSSDSYLLLGGGGQKAISDFMLKSDELTTNLTTITKSLNVTADWMDTGIKSTDLSKGTYIIQVSVSGNDSTARMWDCIWSGIMSWDPQVTNGDEPDEIILHRAGHAYANTIYIRTLMTPRDTSGVGLKLQIAANKNIGAAYTYTFKFKRVI